jgi:hypothetical protein
VQRLPLKPRALKQPQLLLKAVLPSVLRLQRLQRRLRAAW